MKHHRLCKTWEGMIARCYHKTNISYKNYGAIGITVCKRWHDVRNFIEDMEGLHKEGLTLDRIDNNKSYSKENCRFQTRSIQMQNTRRIYNHNKSGYRGVSLDKINKTWRATVGINKKKIQLGRFKTPLEAAKIRDQYVIDNNLEHTLNGVL